MRRRAVPTDSGQLDSAPISPRRAAVVGKPIEHSLSPVLHRAAYRALGLASWSYERCEVDDIALASFVSGLSMDWVGLSVTMPDKRAAFDLAAETTARARAVGAANTLVRKENGRWLADCTDVDGVTGALRSAGGLTPSANHHGTVLGAGGTAAAAVVAFAELGITQVRLVVRDPARAEQTRTAAQAAGLEVEVLRWSDVDFASIAGDTSVLVSTAPSSALTPHLRELSAVPCVLDVIYDPWPTPLADAVIQRGGSCATGLDMLLHQAFGQVELFTGRPAPKTAMRDALREASGNRVPLTLD
jgi:shikimate dehydrogenase